jgi:MFS transporter, ACS family, hexuronate transporter
VAQSQSVFAPTSYSWPRRNLRWIVAGLLCAVTVINYVDRVALSVVAPILKSPVANGGLGITQEEYGFIMTTFLVLYVVGQGIGGVIMDKLGTKMGFAFVLTFWSIATICHRFASGMRSFAFWRGALGVGEAGNWPGAIKSIAEWFPAKERGVAAAIFNSGTALGAVLAPPIMMWVTLKLGWRNGFVVAGLLGFVWLAIWMWFYKLPRQHPLITPGELAHIEAGQESVSEERTEKIPMLQLLRYRQVWGIVLPRMLSEPVWWLFVFWLPSYLVEARGFSLMKMAWVAAIPFIAGGFGCVFGGGLSSYLMRKGWSADRARKTVMVISAFLMPVGLFVYNAKSAWVAIALISIMAFGHQGWATNILTLPADIFPQKVVGSVTGLSGMAIIASAVTQWNIGYVVQHFSYQPILNVAGLLHPTAAIVMLLLIGKVRSIDMNHKVKG